MPGYMWAVMGLLVMCLAGILWLAIEVDALGHVWSQENPCKGCTVEEYDLEEGEDA